MDDLMDMLVGGEASSSDVSDKIKEILYAKASDKVNAVRPQVGASLFGEDEIEDEEEETQTGETEE